MPIKTGRYSRIRTKITPSGKHLLIGVRKTGVGKHGGHTELIEVRD
jgi:hypothetical protein